MRTKLADRKLPDYSMGEEKFNMVSHIVGGGFAILSLVVCVIISVFKQDVFSVVSSAIYGVSMIVLYCMSSIYHGLRKGTAKKVFQVLDHCTIYFLIAGTYTPIALSAIRPVYPALGWTIFGVEWGLAAFAVVLTAIDLNKYKTFSLITYICMGLFVLVFFNYALEVLTHNGFILLILGGICYLVGAALYKRNKKYMHNVFHILVILGSLFHLFMIIFYVLL